MLPSHHVHQALEAAKPRALMVAALTMRQSIAGGAPDRARSLRHYAALAQFYELRTANGDHGRRELVEQLAPRRGEVILDMGCGTGRNFDQIQARIGSGGLLIGVEPCPEMLARAEALVARRGWRNVQLICAGAEEAMLPTTVDAALLCAVHDVMRSPRALANIIGHIGDTGRIVAGGPRWVPWRQLGAVKLNLTTWRLNRGCVTTFAGFQRPWSGLAELLPHLEVEERYGGAGYVAAARPHQRQAAARVSGRRCG
jgi:SAM-dependent methyltransferase